MNVDLSELPADKLCELKALSKHPSGIKFLQVRVGPMAGPLLEGTMEQIQEFAGAFGLAAQNMAESFPIHWPIGGGVIIGRPSEFMELASQIGDICGGVMLETPTPNYSNLGRIG